MAFRSNDTKTSTKKGYWLRHHKRWERSGISQAEYCRKEGIPLSSFTNWRSKLSRGCGESADFVEVAPLHLPPAGAYLELVIPSVGTLRIPESIRPEQLRHILLAVKEIA
jgi:hypothetical protein